VECIRDHPKRGSVKIPEQLVEYVCGRYRATKQQQPSSSSHQQQQQQRASPQPHNKKAHYRRKQPHPPPQNQSVRRLSDQDRAEYERSTRRGYLAVSYQHQRGRGSTLVKAHREWCTAKNKPHIVLFKSVGDSSVDQVRLDLSTIHGIWDHDNDDDILLLMKHELWKLQIIKAAEGANMDLCGLEEKQQDFDDEYSPTNCFAVDDVDDEDNDDGVEDEDSSETATAWIAKLPSTLFAGERTRAKAMAAQLAEWWEIPTTVVDNDVLFHHAVISNNDVVHHQRGGRKNNKQQRHTSEYNVPRRRGGGNRQAWREHFGGTLGEI
jgi:hypothetical protein